jgi:hypothetical protein
VKNRKQKKFSWERPILHARIRIGARVPDVVNLHLKSRIPMDIKDRKLDTRTLKTLQKPGLRMQL